MYIYIYIYIHTHTYVRKESLLKARVAFTMFRKVMIRVITTNNNDTTNFSNTNHATDTITNDTNINHINNNTFRFTASIQWHDAASYWNDAIASHACGTWSKILHVYNNQETNNNENSNDDNHMIY